MASVYTGAHVLTPPKTKSSRYEQGELSSPDRSRGEDLKAALRKQYEDVKNERVPDRLQRLIDALREAEHMAREKDKEDG